METGAGSRQLAERFLPILSTLERLGRIAGARPTRLLGAGAGGFATFRSGADLGLTTEATAATRLSAEEVNAIPTSFTPRDPGFQGASTANPTIGGIYNGNQGDDTLTVRVRTGGVYGVDKLQLEVLDGAGDVIDRVNISKNAPPGEVRPLSNGLNLALDGGTLVKNDSFEIDVFASLGSAVDPNNPFDGTGASHPGFEPGLGVNAGSFTLNGTTIAVQSSDTLLDVLARIEASAAGVSASFDALSETVVLTQKTLGSAPGIVLGSDSSGFLDAVKLSGATTSPGQDDERAIALAQVPRFASVGSGHFFVNGQEIQVDPAIDSLQDVLDRIRALVPSATATYDEAQGQVVLSAPGSLTLEGDTSGLLAALELEEGTETGGRTAGVTTASRLSARDETTLVRGLQDLFRHLNGVFRTDFTGLPTALVTSLEESLGEAFEGAFVDVGKSVSSANLRSGFGIDFLRSGNDDAPLELDGRALERALRKDPRSAGEFLFGDGDDPGLLSRLDGAFDAAVRRVRLQLDSSRDQGLLLDLRV